VSPSFASHLSPLFPPLLDTVQFFKFPLSPTLLVVVHPCVPLRQRFGALLFLPFFLSDPNNFFCDSHVRSMNPQIGETSWTRTCPPLFERSHWFFPAQSPARSQRLFSWDMTQASSFHGFGPPSLSHPSSSCSKASDFSAMPRAILSFSCASFFSLDEDLPFSLMVRTWVPSPLE